MQNPSVDADSILARREKNYKRNYITLLCESFFFTFSLTMFSYTTVLPVYVSKLTQNAMFISLISVIYYGFSYGAGVFSAVIGINAKSPKWISIWVCGLQRVGFILIFLSTYVATGNAGLALALFFISFSVYAVSVGMSSPMFGQMVATAIHRNVGGFYGSYSLVGSASGVLASTVMTQIFKTHSFPGDYRLLFLIGTLTALTASVVVGVGVREVTDDRSTEKIRFSELFGLLRNVFKTNRAFARYVAIKALVGAAEFSVPYFIVRVAALEDVPAGFVGVMTTTFLLSGMLASKVMGWLGDRRGPLFMLAAACLSGAVAAALALWMPGYLWCFPMFLFLGLAERGVYLSGGVACIEYSNRVRTPLYSAAAGLASSQVYIAASLLGGVLSSRFSISCVFVAALCVYTLCFLLCCRFVKGDIAADTGAAVSR